MADLNRLRAVLNASGLQSRDNATWQVISEMLTNLIALGARAGVINALQGDESLVTAEDEPTLPNHRKLVAGTNITLVDSPAINQLKINSSGGVGSGGMEYLGDYTTPFTYNDGDIVVAADGIAYVCVVNGTTTPPEPWPGIGVAINAAIDATYWLKDAHPQLINGRPLAALGNGYVKSLSGEPSVVATIPLTDTTGILPDARLTSNVALKNIDNNFVPQTFSSGTFVIGAEPNFWFRDNIGAADHRQWRMVVSGGGFFIDSWNDAFSVIFAQYYFRRDGVLQAAAFQGDGSRLTNIIPVGTIVIRTDACPVGWTRVAWDGQFLRVGAAFSTANGGNPTTHSHAAGTLSGGSHTHDSGSLNIPSHNHGGSTGSVGISISGSTGGGGGHSHGFSGTTGGESAGQMNVDAGSSGNMTRAPHTHGFSGSTDSEANHTHSFSGSGSGTGSIPNQGSISVSGNTGTGGGTLGGSTAAASHLPPFYDVILCRKD